MLKSLLDLQNALQMRICQTGVVVEILCGYFSCNLNGSPFFAMCNAALAKRTAYRLPYVKYSTGANEATRIADRALGKPDSTAARRAFLAESAFGEWCAGTKCFFRRDSAISRPASLFCILFSDKPEKSMPPEAFRTDWCRKWAFGASAMGLRRDFAPNGAKNRKGVSPFPVSQFSESSRK